MEWVAPSTDPLHPGLSRWEMLAVLGASSSGLPPLEEHLETSPDLQRWEQTFEGQQGQARAHPSIVPVTGYFFLVQHP